MANRRCADSKPGIGPKLFQIVQPQLFPNKESVVKSAIRRAEPVKFIEIILNPGLLEDGTGDNAAADMSDSETIAARGKNLVGRLAPPATRHELTNDVGITRNI